AGGRTRAAGGSTDVRPGGPASDVLHEPARAHATAGERPGSERPKRRASHGSVGRGLGRPGDGRDRRRVGRRAAPHRPPARRIRGSGLGAGGGGRRRGHGGLGQRTRARDRAPDGPGRARPGRGGRRAAARRPHDRGRRRPRSGRSAGRDTTDAGASLRGQRHGPLDSVLLGGASARGGRGRRVPAGPPGGGSRSTHGPESRLGGRLGTLRQDLRFALRRLAANPGFTAVAIATLALGIGANTAIFSVVDGVLLRPLPYANPEALRTVPHNLSPPELADAAVMTHSFENIGGVALNPFDLQAGSEPVQVTSAMASGALFETLGARAALGRALTRDDDRRGGDRVAVLGDAIWRREFGADPSI